MAKLSQYERDREANIAKNRALLEQLELKQAVDDLGFTKPKPATKNTKAQPVQPSRKPRKKEETEPPVTRRSTRLRHVPEPNESPSMKRKREAEVEEERAKEAEARIEAEERERQAKRPRHGDLDMATLVGMDEAEDTSALQAELSSLTTYARPIRGGDPPDSDDIPDSAEKHATEELKEKLGGLRVISRAKVTMDRIYSSAYHPDVQKDLIFFGDKHGELGIWDARAPREENDEDEDENENRNVRGKYWRLQVHWPATSKSSISCIKFDPANHHTVYTSAYDCTIRNLTFTSGVSREIYSSGDTLITSLDLTPGGHEMWISDAAGGLTHLDLRQGKSSARRYGLSDNKIGSVSINPVRPNFLVTASNNRALKIWDVRNLQEMAVRGAVAAETSLEFDGDMVQTFLDSKKGRGCFRGEWRHGKSVSSAYWDPKGRRIVSTSYDDKIRLWDYQSSVFDTKDKFPSLRPHHTVPHNCQTGKWLTILRAQWSPNPDAHPHFTIGNMNHSLDIRTGTGDLVARLEDRNKITAVQAVTCSHPSIVERVASGNGSGRCVLWAPKGLAPTQ